jgi:hypothetical protein
MSEDELNDRIRQLCKERGYTFKPWETEPADATEGPSPWPAGAVGTESWAKAQALRRQLIAEIEGYSNRIGRDGWPA